MGRGRIGQWARRNRSDARFHRIESEIAKRVVAKCGRELNLVQRGLALTIQRSAPHGMRCHYCETC